MRPTPAKAWTSRRAVLVAGLGALVSTRPLRADHHDDPWSEGVPLPFGVQEIYPTAFENRIVLAGGIVDNHATGIAASDRTIIYVPEKSIWLEGPALPMPLHHPGLVASPDHVLAMGGFAANDGGFWQMQRSVFMLDREFRHWRVGPPLPVPRAEFVTAQLGDEVIVIGGRTPKGRKNQSYGDHVDVNETLLLDLATLQWRFGRPAPTARNSAAGAVIEGKLHVVGGRVSASGGIRNLGAHDVYDPFTDRWSKRAPMPKAQGGLAAAADKNKLYAFGGEFFGARSGVFREVWSYDQTADSWQAAAPMPIPRHGLGAVTLTDGIHIIGGATRAGAEGRSEQHDVFRPT